MANIQSREMYGRIRKIIEDARGNIARAVNAEMVIAYWQIGKEIVEEEQRGKSRAEYGKKLLEGLARRLSEDFGKGFDDSNLWNMRKFYQAYPILDAVRRELSWTHYRTLKNLGTLLGFFCLGTFRAPTWGRPYGGRGNRAPTGHFFHCSGIASSPCGAPRNDRGGSWLTSEGFVYRGK